MYSKTSCACPNFTINSVVPKWMVSDSNSIFLTYESEYIKKKGYFPISVDSNLGLQVMHDYINKGYIYFQNSLFFPYNFFLSSSFLQRIVTEL